MTLQVSNSLFNGTSQASSALERNSLRYPNRHTALRHTDSENENNADSATYSKAHKSRLQAQRKERTKVRASKMFEKQYAGAEISRESAEGAPRAALYATKMGAKHRKSARMQRASAAGTSRAKLDSSGWFSAIPLTARSLKIGTAILCAFLICLFLYTPAQQYYQAQREYDRFVAESNIIEKRNQALDAQNDILASEAGMEDAVRQKYGFVKQGEQVAVVTGLSDRTADVSSSSKNIEASVLAGSVRAPEEWYTPFLDAFFGVE